MGQKRLMVYGLPMQTERRCRSIAKYFKQIYSFILKRCFRFVGFVVEVRTLNGNESDVVFDYVIINFNFPLLSLYSKFFGEKILFHTD